jgi:hypothetical protein
MRLWRGRRGGLPIDSQCERGKSGVVVGRRSMRGKPSCAAQKPIPPYRLAATYRSDRPAALNSAAEGQVVRSAQKLESSVRIRSSVHRRRPESPVCARR